MINEKKILQKEMQTIEQRFRYLCFGSGVSKEQYDMFSKSFWFNMINRYKEIESRLNIEANDDSMEMLMATVYALDGNETCAYDHIQNHVKITNSGLYLNFLSNFLETYHGTMADVIDIVTEKLQTTKEGIVRDSYINFIADLKKREKDIMEESHA